MMIPMVNLNNMVDKQLEGEHPSIQRTRRWIAEANQNVFESWYATKANPISGSVNNLDRVSKVAGIEPRWKGQSSIFTRLSNFFNTRRQPARSEVLE